MSELKAATIAGRLNESIPKEFISEKQGLSYVSHRYVKNRLNEVFGWDGWEYAVQETKLDFLDEESVRWFSHIQLSVFVGEVAPHGFRRTVTRDGVALGHGGFRDFHKKLVSDTRRNEIIDFAAAESVTDAIKRAAVSLGNSMGLELYPMTKGGKKPPKKKSKEDW